MSVLDRHRRALWLASLAFLLASVALDLLRPLPPRAQAANPTRPQPAPAAQAAPPLRVLFVGNSLTSTNDLPGMIQKLAASAGEPRRFEARALTFGGFLLRDHLAANRVPGALAEGRWDSVVLQEQSQIPGYPVEKREAIFFSAARQLEANIRKAGARTVFYETFARREGDQTYTDDSYTAMQTRVNEGYAQIARELSADTVPVGHVWQRMVERRPTLRLWVQDGSHPTVAGTYLAACTFYVHFYARSPVGNRYLAGLDPADARALQQAAADQRWPTDAPAASAAPPPPARQPIGVAAPTSWPGEAVGAAELEAARERARLEAEQDRKRHESLEQQRTSRAKRFARGRVPITLYSTTWCPACKRASAYLREQDIAFTEHDVEADPRAHRTQLRLNPKGTVPTLEVGTEVLVGWSEERFNEALEVAARRR